MLVCVIVMVLLKCVEQHFNAGLCNSHGSSKMLEQHFNAYLCNSHGSSKMCRAALQCWFV